MDSIRDVIIYSGLGYYAVLNLPLDTFLLMRRNKFIDDCNRSEAGRKYLADCKRLSTTEPDYEAIHEFQKERKV